MNNCTYCTQKQRFISESELDFLDISHSTIYGCLIKKNNQIISVARKYRGILIDIWKIMSLQTIYQKSSFNIKFTNENGVLGYNWCKTINMSFQDKNAKGTLREILKMTKLCELSLYLSIKLKNNIIVHFKIE